jgi:hypothetical protein
MELSLQGVALRCDQLRSSTEPGRQEEFYKLLEEVTRIPLVRHRMGALEELLRVAIGCLKYGRIDVLQELLEIRSLPRSMRANYTLQLAIYLRHTPGSEIFSSERLSVYDDALALAYECGGCTLRDHYANELKESDLSRDIDEFNDLTPNQKY